jgi:hypothetical protein
MRANHQPMRQTRADQTQAEWKRQLRPDHQSARQMRDSEPTMDTYALMIMKVIEIAMTLLGG